MDAVVMMKPSRAARSVTDSLNAKSPAASSYACGRSALDRTGGQAADELTLAEDEEGDRRHDDDHHPGHDQAPAQRLLVSELDDPDLHGPHDRLVRDQERPEVHVPGRQEAVHR